MRYDDLPHRWKDKLKSYLTRKHGVVREYLSPEDFICYSTKIDFEDDSSALFMHSFLLEAPDFKEIAVFTEHCGYHIFLSGSIESINCNTNFNLQER